MNLIQKLDIDGYTCGVWDRIIGHRKVRSVGAWTTDLELRVLMDAAQWHASHKGCRACEVGSWCGDSAVALCHGMELGEHGGSLVCIDHWEGTASDISGKIAQGLNTPIREIFHENTWGLDEIHPYNMSSKDAAKVLAKASRKFDLIFLDAGHTYDEIMADLNLFWPLLDEGGTMLGHDYHKPFDGVMQATQEFAALYGQELFVMKHGSVWGMGNLKFLGD